jgi:hypothetical protein
LPSFCFPFFLWIFLDELLSFIIASLALFHKRLEKKFSGVKSASLELIRTAVFRETPTAVDTSYEPEPLNILFNPAIKEKICKIFSH